MFNIEQKLLHLLDHRETLLILYIYAFVIKC